MSPRGNAARPGPHRPQHPTSPNPADRPRRPNPAPADTPVAQHSPRRVGGAWKDAGVTNSIGRLCLAPHSSRTMLLQLLSDLWFKARHRNVSILEAAEKR